MDTRELAESIIAQCADQWVREAEIQEVRVEFERGDDKLRTNLEIDIDAGEGEAGEDLWATVYASIVGGVAEIVDVEINEYDRAS